MFGRDRRTCSGKNVPNKLRLASRRWVKLLSASVLGGRRRCATSSQAMSELPSVVQEKLGRGCAALGGDGLHPVPNPLPHTTTRTVTACPPPTAAQWSGTAAVAAVHARQAPSEGQRFGGTAGSVMTLAGATTGTWTIKEWLCQWKFPHTDCW